MQYSVKKSLRRGVGKKDNRGKKGLGVWNREVFSRLNARLKGVKLEGEEESKKKKGETAKKKLGNLKKR